MSAGTGRGTTIYVVDSGIRLSHQEFLTQDGSRSRASYGERLAAVFEAGGSAGSRRAACPSPSRPLRPAFLPPPPLLLQATILLRMTTRQTTAMDMVRERGKPHSGLSNSGTPP